MFGAGMVFGPAGGGLLFSHFGFAAPFLAAAFLQFVTVMLTVFLLPESREKPAEEDRVRMKDVFECLRRPGLSQHHVSEARAFALPIRLVLGDRAVSRRAARLFAHGHGLFLLRICRVQRAVQRRARRQDLERGRRPHDVQYRADVPRARLLHGSVRPQRLRTRSADDGVRIRHGARQYGYHRTHQQQSLR